MTADHWTLKLKPPEVQICTWVGRQRFENARRARRDVGLGPTAGKDVENDIRGACCEYAASILLNLYWRPTIGEITERDVGGLVEVRSTVLPHGRLIVKPDADDDAPYALMFSCGNDCYRMLGWCFAGDAKTFPLVTKFGDPAHFVGQDDLLAPEDLDRWILRQRLSEIQIPFASDTVSRSTNEAPQ